MDKKILRIVIEENMFSLIISFLCLYTSCVFLFQPDGEYVGIVNDLQIFLISLFASLGIAAMILGIYEMKEDYKDLINEKQLKK